MRRQAPVISPVLRRRAAELGTRGDQWIAGLGALLDDLAPEWSLTVLGPLRGGTAAHVVRVRTAERKEAVLKLALPSPAFHGEARVLLTARGRGYARVLTCDVQRRALLLEHLGPSLTQLTVGWRPATTEAR